MCGGKVSYICAMTARRKKHERISIDEINKMLDIYSFYNLSPGVIDLAYEEAKDRVVALAANIDLVQERMMILLGWFAAAEISLVGVLVGLVSSGSASPISFWMCLYGIVALGAILVYMVSRGLYGTEVIEAGDTPDHFLHSEIVEKLNGLEKKEDQQFYLKIWYLSMFQEAAIVNTRTNNRLVHVYRTIMWFVLSAVALGAILLLILALAL